MLSRRVFGKTSRTLGGIVVLRARDGERSIYMKSVFGPKAPRLEDARPFESVPQRRLRRIGGRSCSLPILRFLSEREFGYCVGSAHHHEGTPAEEEVTAAGPQESHAETAALHCEARAGPPPERPGCNQAIDAMGMPLVTVWDIRERMPLSSSTAACSAVMFSSRLVCMACGIHCCQIVQRARAAERYDPDDNQASAVPRSTSTSSPGGRRPAFSEMERCTPLLAR